MTTIFHRLRLVWLALVGLGWITTLSFGAVVVQSSTIDAVTYGYDMAGAFNQSCDEKPRPVWNEKQAGMADEGTFFGSMAQFNAAKGLPNVTEKGLARIESHLGNLGALGLQHQQPMEFSLAQCR